MQRLQKSFLWAAKPYLRDYISKPTNAKICLRFSKSDYSSCNLRNTSGFLSEGKMLHHAVTYIYLLKYTLKIMSCTLRLHTCDLISL